MNSASIGRSAWPFADRAFAEFLLLRSASEDCSVAWEKEKIPEAAAEFSEMPENAGYSKR
jgi:hypothetical protein